MISVNELIFHLYKFFKTQSTMHTRANARATFLAEKKKYAQRVIDKNIVNRAFMLHAQTIPIEKKMQENRKYHSNYNVLKGKNN